MTNIHKLSQKGYLQVITLQEIHERDKRPPSVTVSMICYNHSKYIDEAIQSVLMQKTNFPVNIVIHDDASPDGSAEIIRKYAAENPNITAILQPVNLVQNGKSLQPFLLPHYTGKYVAYCECDDFWITPDKLQFQVDYLESNPDCVAVYSNTLPVNKYSKYDENIRHFPKTGEGDYHTWDLPGRGAGGIRHQMASLMIRNFWRLMSAEDIDYYMSVKANGDEKMLAFCMSIGRVHYFAKELAAYRQVIDEGDSYSARLLRMDKYDALKHGARWVSELYLMGEHLFHKKYFRKYINVLWYELKGRLQFRRSVIKEADLNPVYSLRNIPLYVWPVFAFYAPMRLALIVPKKLLTGLKKLVYHQLSALSSQLSALSSWL